MKRTLLVVAVAALMAVYGGQQAQAETGVGIQFGEPGNVGLSLRFENIAVGAAWSFAGDGYLAVDADYWIIKENLAKNLDWFLGPGVGIRLGDPFRLAIRGVPGLQWKPAPEWEIFGQVAPALQIINEIDFEFGGAVGVRYCF